jgi:hypothetical protein
MNPRASWKSDGTIRRICVECLRCGHCGTIREIDLPSYGEEPGAPIARFVKRLVCQECDGHSVKAFRMTPQDENA